MWTIIESLLCIKIHFYKLQKVATNTSSCPTNYADYYSPQKCVAVSSLRGGSIFFIVHDGAKVLFYERINLKYRIRKFKTYDDSFIAITDFTGIIIGKLSEITP